MNNAPEPTAPADQALIARLVDLETEALLSSVLGGFLEIDLQFKPVVGQFTGGDVITHLSREADRMADKLFEATGRPVPLIDTERQYEIDLGGMRPAAVLIEDFVESSTRLRDAMTGVHDVSSLREDVRDLPARRLVQLVVHHADLGRPWDAISEEVAAIVVIQLATAPADDGAAVVTGDARALLAVTSGRVGGADSGGAAVEPATPRRIWF